eukprot:CAMPEP_0119216188 /NCGR_PEP_ID=MMETSP1327-20130426/14465_1 /TAXON_ID=38833 /ORGANISM="Micromonas pusilla, Strain RCC2306" /LENGTH=143 /DNA_ID=CAMNT_0007214075 /DNA_START=285 /DNA_END=716 /DNA_ORIENTATION=+
MVGVPARGAHNDTDRGNLCVVVVCARLVDRGRGGLNVVHLILSIPSMHSMVAIARTRDASASSSRPVRISRRHSPPPVPRHPMRRLELRHFELAHLQHAFDRPRPAVRHVHEIDPGDLEPQLFQSARVQGLPVVHLLRHRVRA